MNNLTREFLLEPGLTYLNHASYGYPTRAALDRAWTGRSVDGVTIVRISTHVYNETADAVPLIEAKQRVLRPG